MLINEKKALRILYSSLRKGIDAETKKFIDLSVTSRLINSDIFKKCNTVLIYASFGSEINTGSIIDFCLKNGKTVAVPVWSDGNMDFYLLKSRKMLSENIGNIKTVSLSEAEIISDFTDCLCAVPALSFDENGARLGFGGGYYDRFLTAHQNITTVGLCCERCISGENLPQESHDKKVDYIITENRFISVSDYAGRLIYG